MKISLHIIVLIVRGCFDRTLGLNKLFLHDACALLVLICDKPSRIFACILLTQSHDFSGAIWNKQALVNFFKDHKLHSPYGLVKFC